MLTSLFRAIVWTSSPANAMAAKPLAASIWRAERIARFKAGIEALRQEAEEEEDYTGVGVPRQYPGKPRCLPMPEPQENSLLDEEWLERQAGMPPQTPGKPRWSS